MEKNEVSLRDKIRPRRLFDYHKCRKGSAAISNIKAHKMLYFSKDIFITMKYQQKHQ